MLTLLRLPFSGLEAGEWSPLHFRPCAFFLFSDRSPLTFFTVRRRPKMLGMRLAPFEIVDQHLLVRSVFASDKCRSRKWIRPRHFFPSRNAFFSRKSAFS